MDFPASESVIYLVLLRASNNQAIKELVSFAPRHGSLFPDVYFVQFTLFLLHRVD